MNDDDFANLAVRLRAVLDEGVRPVSAEEAQARSRPDGGLMLAEPPRMPRARPSLAAVVGVAAVVVLLAGAVAFGIGVGVGRHGARPAHHNIRPPVAGLLPGPTGPCTGQPPGCGSTASTAEALAKGSWSRFPRGPLSPRTGQLEVWTGRELIVWGGTPSCDGSCGPVDDGAAYNPATHRWRMLPPSPLSSRSDAGAVWTGSEMVVIGGEGHSGESLDNAAAYDEATNTWTRLPSPPIAGEQVIDALWTGRQVVVLSGVGADAVALSRYEMTAFDPATNAWAMLPALPTRRGTAGLTLAWTGRQLIAWITWQRTSGCGKGCIETSEAQAGYALSVRTTRWRDLGKPPLQTGGAFTAWTGSNLLVMGGEYCPWSCPPPEGHGAVYDPATNTWRKVPRFVVFQQWPPLWTGKAFVDVSTAETSSYVRVHDLLRAYEASTGRWRTLPAPPGVVYGNPAVWTGTQLLVWGGRSEVLTAAR